MGLDFKGPSDFKAWSLSTTVMQESDLRIRQTSLSVIIVPGDNLWIPFLTNPGSVPQFLLSSLQMLGMFLARISLQATSPHTLVS